MIILKYAKDKGIVLCTCVEEMRIPKPLLQSSTELIKEPRYLSQTMDIVSLGFILSISDFDVLTQDLSSWITEVRTIKVI